MLHIFDGVRAVNDLSVLVRMLTAFLCGAAIGMERSYKNRPAGFRTHILVCVAACMASMTGVYLYLNMGLPTDIARLGAQVVSGLGFIGGGTIIVTKRYTVNGLTTAAGLWVTGIIGLAVGAGFYEGGLAVTVLVLLTETVLFRISQRIQHVMQFEVRLSYRDKEVLDRVLRYCKDQRLGIRNLKIISRATDGETPWVAQVALAARNHVDEEVLLGHLRDFGGVISAEICDS